MNSLLSENIVKREIDMTGGAIQALPGRSSVRNYYSWSFRLRTTGYLSTSSLYRKQLSL